MSPTRRHYEDRLVETALEEKLGGAQPPDLSEQVLATLTGERVQTAEAKDRRVSIRALALFAVSACLLVAVAAGSWAMHESPQLAVAAAGGAADDPAYEGVFLDSYTLGDLAHGEALAQEIAAREDSLTKRQAAHQVLVDSKGLRDGENPMLMVTPRIVSREADSEALLLERSQGTADRAKLERLVETYQSERDAFIAERQRINTEIASLASQVHAKNREVQLSTLAQVEKSLNDLGVVADTPLLYPDAELWAKLNLDAKAVQEITAALPREGATWRDIKDAIEDLREDRGRGPGEGGDQYSRIVENPFLRALDSPLSTFSIDVDTASYSKTRMYLLQQRMLPPPDAVRIEELVNYFDYEYDGPADEHPFAAHLEAAECPWNPQHRLVRIALKGREVGEKRPAANLVFLLDVSGSMNQPNKLPLVKAGMKMLARQLDEDDRVAIVVYAGAAGLVLPSTPGSERAAILDAIDRLEAGGSTNGGEGIRLAYQTALDHFLNEGVNRVVLCTDGDFNVGVTSTGELTRLAEEQAKAGVFLSVLGFGMGNHNDAMLEELSGKANGNYAFIDTESEARKVLVEQMSGTLVTIAKDVKIQVEFNPAEVAAYRLLGYENRILAAEDFNDDKKDAGEIGAGHTVTALYEIVPTQASGGRQPPDDAAVTPPAVDDLKYQKKRKLTQDADSGELLTLKLRYKRPDAETSTLMTAPLKGAGGRFSAAGRDFQFAAAVAAFGMILRDSQYHGDATLDAVEEIAESAKGPDRFGYRAEFLEMVEAAKQLRGE